MKRSPHAQAERFIWRFYNRGGEGQYTRRFSGFDPGIQARLLQLAEVQEGEVPAIAAYIDDANWALLTNQQLIWSEKSLRSQINLVEVSWAKAEPLEAAHAKMPHADCFKDKPPPRLFIFTKQGEKKELPCEPRGPFFGFLNVLQMVASMRPFNDETPNS